jgi:hypothetical protein
MSESLASQVFHGLSFGTTILILGILLRQHKIWTRVKDRLDELWAEYCKSKGIRFKPIENGKD